MNQLRINNKKLLQNRYMSTAGHQAHSGGGYKGLLTTLLLAGGGVAYIKYINEQNNNNIYEKTHQRVSQSSSTKRTSDEPTNNLKNEARESASASASNVKDNNPMVHEKMSSSDTKPESEKKLEGYSTSNVRDTSNLAKKDTDKVKGVWEGGKTIPNPLEDGDQHGSTIGFWNSIFRKKTPENTTTSTNTKESSITNNIQPELPVEQTSKTVFVKASTAHGNPMVYEKRSIEQTKPNWEKNIEEYAEHTVHDTSTLVGKDTEKVRGVWEDKAIRDLGRTPPKEQEHATSFWSHLFGKAQDIEKEVEKEVAVGTEKASETWNDVKSKAASTQNDISTKVKDKSNEFAHKASESASNLSQKIKDATTQTAEDLEKVQHDSLEKGSELKRQASDSLKGIHDEVLANTDKWKSQTEQNAKSWYEKSTEQVKNRFGSIKSTADKDLEWAGQKAQDGMNTAKEEVDRVLGNKKQNNLSDHVIRGEKFAEEEEGQLKPTYSNIKPRSAEAVVSNARGKDM